MGISVGGKVGEPDGIIVGSGVVVLVGPMVGSEDGLMVGSSIRGGVSGLTVGPSSGYINEEGRAEKIFVGSVLGKVAAGVRVGA